MHVYIIRFFGFNSFQTTGPNLVVGLCLIRDSDILPLLPRLQHTMFHLLLPVKVDVTINDKTTQN